jgi:hypothetical protein
MALTTTLRHLPELEESEIGSPETLWFLAGFSGIGWSER